VNADVNTTLRRDGLTIAASGAEVRRASEWLSTICQQSGIPVAQAQRLEICLNEVLANVLAHGGSMALVEPILLQLKIGCAAGIGEAYLTVSDAGVAFNPLAVDPPPRPHALADARAEGMGLVMIRRCADELDYRHENGHNHFTFGTRWNCV
jgi:serine/threonine-protein kinase RsbW